MLHNGEENNRDMNDARLNEEITNVHKRGVATMPGNQYFTVPLPELLGDTRRQKTRWIAVATILVDAEHLHNNGQQSLYRYFRTNR